MANVANGAISEALRHIVLSGIQVDILENTVVTKEDGGLLDTHFLIKQEHVGMKVI